MSLETSKFKSGITLIPTDPFTLTNPSIGDIVCDSTDSNKIKEWNGKLWVTPTTDLPGVTEDRLFISPWNGSTNTPTLADGVGIHGQWYSVFVAGTLNGTSYAINDKIVYWGGKWVNDKNINLNGQRSQSTYFGLATVGPWSTTFTVAELEKAKTSGTLETGKTYQITTFIAGDDFTNIGAASNATDVVFTATGTTPTTWTNASTVSPAVSIAVSVVSSDPPTMIADIVSQIQANADLRSRGFYCYPVSDQTEYNPYYPTVYNHGYIKGPLGQPFKLTTNPSHIDRFAGNDVASFIGQAQRITNLATPLVASDASTKGYVDTAVSGSVAKTVVDVKGDLIVATAADTVARLQAGTNGQVLTVDSAEATGLKWAAPAASSSSIGIGDLDTLAADDAQTAVLADYTQTGLEILTSTQIHGTAAFRLIHQNASTYSFKKTIAVDPKFRGKNNTLVFDLRSSAASSNVTVLVRDETNSATLTSGIASTNRNQVTATTTSGIATLSGVSSADYNSFEVGDTVTGAGIPTGTRVLSKTLSGLVITLSANATASATVTLSVSSLPARQSYTFDVPSNCLSMSWTISALQEANLPETYVDDVVVKLSATANTSASITTTTFNTEAMTLDPNFTPTSFGTVTEKNIYKGRQGDLMNIRGYWRCGTTTASVASLDLPSGFTIDSAKFGTKSNIVVVGQFNQIKVTATPGGPFTQGYSGLIFYDGSTTDKLFFSGATESNVLNKATASSVQDSNGYISVTINDLPITSWTASITTSQTIQLTSSVLVQDPDSELRITGFVTSYASTATRILRTLNAATAGTIQKNTGSAIKLEDDSVNGTRITALKDGVYSLQFSTDLGSAAGVGFSLNSSSLTTDFNSLSGAEKLSSQYEPGSSATLCVSWTGALKTGDIVRPHGTGGLTGPDASFSMLQVTCQGKLSQLNPSSDQKIEIPTSELRFEGSSSRGGTDTSIVKFDNLVSTKGDGFSVVNTSANGTVVTVLKDGILSVSAGMYFASAGIQNAISKNQVTLTSYPNQSEILNAAYNAASAYGATTSWTGSVKKNDVIRIAANGTPTGNSINNLTLSLQEQKVAVSLSNVVPQFQDGDGYLRLSAYNSVGATRTRILRFSNLVEQDGLGKFTYADSAADGASITVNEDGIYNIVWGWASANNAAIGMALTKNEVLSSTGSTDATSLTEAQGRIAVTYIGAISTALTAPVVTYSGKLLKGDVIRCHTDANTTNPNPALTYFNITKVGKPSIAAVDVTPFVNLKGQDTQAIETEATTATWGGTNTGIPVYSIRSNTNNGIIRVDSSAANGTSFTVLRDCKASISGGGNGNGTGLPGIYITKNSTILTATSLTASTVLAYATGGVNNFVNAISCNVDLKVGDVIRFQRDSTNLTETRNFSITAVADSTSVVSAAKTYRMSDLLAVGTRVTGADPANLGEYRTLYRATSSNSTLSDTITPTNVPSTANGMFINGGVAFNTAGTNTSPQVYRIFIGKNKQYSISWHNTTGRTGFLSVDRILAAGTDEYGAWEMYDPTTGILSIDAASIVNGGNTSRQLGNKESNATVANGYFDVTVFESPFVSVPQPAKVTALYMANVSATTNGSLPVQWSNRIVDNFGAVTTGSGWRFTAPRADVYMVNGTMDVGITANVYIYKNGVLYQSAGIVYSNTGVIVGCVPMVAGDYIDVRADSSTVGSNVNRFISITSQ